MIQAPMLVFKTAHVIHHIPHSAPEFKFKMNYKLSILARPSHVHVHGTCSDDASQLAKNFENNKISKEKAHS